MDGTVCVVLQRCDRAELLLDNDGQYAKMGRGLIAFISFTREATEDQLKLAAKTLLNLPLVWLILFTIWALKDAFTETTNPGHTWGLG